MLPPKVTHFIIEPKKVGALLRAMRGYEGLFSTQCALRLAPLVFVRPGVLRQAEWSEMDLNKAEWSIPAEKTLRWLMLLKHWFLSPINALWAWHFGRSEISE